MKKVSFTEMDKGTKEDYLFLDQHEKDYASKTADRIIKFLSSLTETLEGYQVSRLEHSLQSATRALKADEDEEMVVAALLHDIGKYQTKKFVKNIGWTFHGHELVGSKITKKIFKRFRCKIYNKKAIIF